MGKNQWMKNVEMVLVFGFSLALAIFAFRSSASELKAGTAKAVITPSDPLGRILVMGGPAKGVKHDLYARALVLDDGTRKMVIVTYDLNCLDVATPILRARCRRELGIDPAYLLLLATHNHAAPIQIVPANFDYGRLLADKIFSLVKEAIANEQGPVRLFFGSTSVDFLRSDPRYPQVYGFLGRPVDSELQLLKVMQGDQPLALLFNLPTHPMQTSFSKIEPGHPGYAVEELEKRFPGTLAMYADGCGADQFANIGVVMLAPLWLVKQLSAKIADAVEKISRGRMTEVSGPLNSKLEVISLPLAPPVSYEQAQKLAKNIPKDIGFVPYPEKDRGSNWIRSLLEHYEQKLPFPTRSDDYICTDDGFLLKELPEPREFPCRYEETIVASIGPMVLVAMQGEVCAPIGKRVKETFRNQKPLMVFAYMGEHNLYIPTRRLVEVNAYQAQVIQTQYASPVGWSPEVEDAMVDGVNKLIESLTGGLP
jgi:hypothetical protein